MSDNNEKITVEVDGTPASEGFGRIGSSAAAADRQIDHLGETLDKTQRKIKDAASAAEQSKSKFDELQKSLFGGGKGTAIWLWDLAADGFRAAIGFADSFIDKISSVQRTISLLNNIPNSNAGAEFEYLVGVANKYGLSLQSIQNDYAKYTLSAQNSSLTNVQVQRSFEQVGIAVRTLHMSQQQAQFTFLALEQMLSKGQVSLQELRRQFSERIPGAMQALAREMGITMPQLLNFITKVGAASDKIMPVLGDALQRMFAGGLQNAVQALDAERNRLETSVTMFFQKVLNAGGAEGMSELLKTINGLLQVDTIAEVFAKAMNSITTNVANFLRTLTTQDIERFAEVALKFLDSFTRLALAAANAVIFLGQHIPEVAGAIGAFAGASAGAPFGPWGAGIGAIVGGAAGYMFGKNIDKGGFGPGSNAETLQAQSAANDQKIADLQNSLKPGWFDSIARPSDKNMASKKAGVEAEIAKLKAENVDIMLRLNEDFNSRYEPLDTPMLDPLKAMLTGTDAQIAAYLKKMYGVNKPDDKLATRQQNFMQNLLARAQSTMEPEEQKFEQIVAQARKIGIGETSSVTDSNGRSYHFSELIDILQNDFNRKRQEKSDAKTSTLESQFTNMQTMFGTEVDKFGEKYNMSNLLQVDEQDWENKSQKMKSLITRELDELGSVWKKRAQESPLFAMKHPDLDGEIAQLRQWGDAYVAEFRRIEAEKRSVMGGTKSFLKEWNENANDFGKLTHDFLKGVTDNIVDMLTNMVMTGHLSFAKLTEFVLAYIAKMLIVQAITPFVNMFAGAISSGLSGLFNVGSSIGASSANFWGTTAPGQITLPGRASGGNVWPGQAFMVGEKGPEVVTFDRPGYVHPNESMKAGGGGNNVNVQVSIDARGNATTSGADSNANLGRKIGDAIRAVLVDERRPGGLLA